MPKERPLVAAVIYNRLKAGMPLGIDATIRLRPENYDEAADRVATSTIRLAVQHANQPGLPPTPIGNPGLASLEAAANPADGRSLYYVVKPGTCGEHFFTDAQAEFNQAAAEYPAARCRRQGGRPPNC